MKRISYIFTIALICAGCMGEPPDPLDLAGIEWIEYRNPRLGMSLRIPEEFQPQEEDDTVIFRLDGYPVLMLNLLDEGTADQRGLWAGHEPIAPATLAGKPAIRYHYVHYDGPYALQTQSWVTDWRKRKLEFAVRTNQERLDPVTELIRESLRLEG